MQYLLSFLEGIITFVSPCLLPMLPVYISYFSGQECEEKKHTALINSIGFVCGFTIFFVILGAFAGSLGLLLVKYKTTVNIVLGCIMVLFGLNFMEVIRIPVLNNTHQLKKVKFKTGFISSLIFGMVFSVSWTPCVGTFLGSALMLAANSGHTFKGILLLLTFSAGLGIPFILSAACIEKLKGTFNFIKKHYRAVNIISGSLLVVLGILIATGLIDYFFSLI